MNKIIIVILFTTGLTACQPNNNQENEIKNSNNPTTPIAQEVLKHCTKDLKICPDGNSVSRNPKNNCEFDSCAEVKKESISKKKEPMMCTADVKECPDGSYVGRDHYNNCQFKKCPNGDNLKAKI